MKENWTLLTPLYTAVGSRLLSIEVWPAEPHFENATVVVVSNGETLILPGA